MLSTYCGNLTYFLHFYVPDYLRSVRSPSILIPPSGSEGKNLCNLGMLVRIGIMARNLGVSTSTLRRWEKKGKYISTLRTLGGHRRYETYTRSNTPKTVALYARVSAHKQKDDLRRQLNTLENHALENDYLIVKKCFDIASGLNDGHQGLLRLLRLCASGVVDRVLITYDDRLARFGAHTHLSDQAKVKQKPLTLLLEGYVTAAENLYKAGHLLAE